MGSPDVKIGITSHPGRRLGHYQNSYSYRSYTSQFDYLWFGLEQPIKHLESDIKRKHKDEIELAGSGHSEWIIGYTVETMVSSVSELIHDRQYKVTPFDKSFFPINRYNVNAAIAWLETHLSA